MRHRRVALAAVLAYSTACSDGIGPDRDPVGPLTLDFCSNEAPIFFAYQNEGANWVPLDPDAEDSYTFDVTERVGIAMTFEYAGEVLTDVYYATRTELLPLSERACIETVGSKQVNGSVVDVATGEVARVNMGAVQLYLEPPPSTFTLTGVPSGPQDLVAHREVTTIEGLVPDRVIIRRAQNPTNNATLAPLDFSSTTASSPTAVNLASFTGLSAGDENFLDVYFETALGTQDTLWLAPLFSNSSQTLYHVPESLTQAGDFHTLNFQADAGSSYRVFRKWYRNPANQNVALGASLATPSISSVGTSPYLRLRATLPVQADYPDFATAYFIQGEENVFLWSVFVTETAGYRGNASSWTLEIPAFPASTGYPVDAALESGNGTQWFVEAFDGALADHIGATPTEGATVRWAGRTSSVTFLRAEGSAGRRVRGRPEILDKRVLGGRQLR